MTKKNRQGDPAGVSQSSGTETELPPAVTFERGIARLEEIVARLEKGEISLEESLSIFEEGVGLTRNLDARLSDAEMKVEQLLRAADRDPAQEDEGGTST